MTENPAAATNDAASLLGSVKRAQTETNFYLRARLPELFVLGNTSALASVIGRDHPTASGTGAVLGISMLLIMGVSYARRRRNLGGGVSPALWVVAAVLFVTSVACNLIAHGDAEAVAIGVCMAGGFLVLGAIERSYVLLGIGGLILPLALVPPGPADKALSVVLGFVALGLVVFAGTRTSHFERKPR